MIDRLDCYDPVPEAELQGPSWAALDLALVDDLTALAWCFPEPGAVFRLVFRFYLPEEAANEDRNRAGIPYRQWADEGHLVLTEGGETDFDRIEAEFLELAEQFDTQQLAYDPMFAAQFTQRLEAEGVNRVEFPQTKSVFATPCAEFERAIKQRRLRHSGNKVAAWCMRNVHAQTDDNGRPLRPIKQKRHSPKKIDGAVVAIMAQALAEAGQLRLGSFYDKNDPEFI